MRLWIDMIMSSVPQVGASIQEVVSRSDITFAMLSDNAAATAVACEVARHIAPGAAWQQHVHRTGNRARQHWA